MLKLYENIKKRRLELHMSQQRLAELTGYADKSMIAKIEKGQIDLSQSKLELFAKVLGVTPGELLGPTDEESFFAPEEYYNNPEVAKLAEEMSSKPGLRVLFDASRDLSEESLKMFAQMIDTFKKTNPEG